jgi:hypothetical protein
MVPDPSIPSYSQVRAELAHPQARKSRLIFVIRVITIAVAIAVLVGLALEPFSTSYSAGVSAGCHVNSSPACPTFHFPVRARVTGTFTTVSGTPVGLQIVGGNGPVFASNASSGFFDFTASNPPYAFAPDGSGNGTTSVVGYWSSALLVL